MRLLEIVHDHDHIEYTNIDLWVDKNKGFTTRKIHAYKECTMPDFNSYDLMILHGGMQHIWDKDKDPWLYREADYVRAAITHNKPVIGLCLGAQIIAEILGGRVYMAEKQEIGWFEINIRQTYREHTLLKGLEEGFETFLWHSDHYTLTEECVSLAYTEAAENQIFFGGRAPVVGFQFHPEYTREIIRFYFKETGGECWKGGRSLLNDKGFLEDLQQRPETYAMFDTLMNNTVEFFKNCYGVLKD